MRGKIGPGRAGLVIGAEVLPDAWPSSYALDAEVLPDAGLEADETQSPRRICARVGLREQAHASRSDFCRYGENS